MIYKIICSDIDNNKNINKDIFNFYIEYLNFIRNNNKFI